METDRMEIIDVNQPKRVRQQISIPFIWESKPGIPKRDWISNPVSLISPPPPSSSPSKSKLVVSVPFQWEEEPGKPLTKSSCSWNPFLAGDDDDYSIGFDLDNFNNPFVTGPTVSDIPFTEEKDEDEPNLFKQSINGESKDSNWQPNFNSLSESEEYSSSSENSITTSQNEASRSGNGFDMELLFALSSPEVSFLGNLFEKNGDDKRGPTGRRELTLGELIMLSRKLSYGNDSQDVHKKNPSKELMKKIRVTCF